MLRRFELLYVVGDERDLIGRRAVYDGSDVYLYPIRAQRDQIRTVFRQCWTGPTASGSIRSSITRSLNNCTLNLVRHVNQLTPGRIPSSWRIIMPGYSDEVIRPRAHRLHRNMDAVSRPIPHQ